jgi:Vitamin B12 dependent methionine synthase, activation domain
MREIVRFTRQEAQPVEPDVLRALGLPEEDAIAPRIRRLLRDATTTYDALVEPRAAWEDIAPEAFAAVLAPLGIPEDSLAVGRIYPRADALALYVATLGEAVPERIRRLFADDALAEAFILDAVASAGADSLSDRLAARFEARLTSEGRAHVRALPYSPGYCGWPTAGQRPLFEALRPTDIGVSLNESCLMTPIKSVSGVLLAGPAESHRFRPDFPFCHECETRECGGRMAAAMSRPDSTTRSEA